MQFRKERYIRNENGPVKYSISQVPTFRNFVKRQVDRQAARGEYTSCIELPWPWYARLTNALKNI